MYKVKTGPDSGCCMRLGNSVRKMQKLFDGKCTRSDFALPLTAESYVELCFVGGSY